MTRWKLKGCPRCGGDVFLDVEEEGWFGHCLQCGYTGNGNGHRQDNQSVCQSIGRTLASPSAEEKRPALAGHHR